MNGPADPRGTRPHVVYWNNIAAPYMVERFNAVMQRGNIDLEVWFGARTAPDRSWTVDESTWRFPYVNLPQLGVGRRRFSLPTTTLSSRRPDLLVSLYSTPSFLIGLRIAWSRGWRTALWVEVTFDSWVRRRRWKEVVKTRVFRRADGIITAGRDGRAFALRYGAAPQRIHIVRHVVDSVGFAEEVTKARFERDQIRADLGLAGVVFVYVGRLWRGKGIDDLLEAYRTLDREFPGDTSLLMVGDGPDEARILTTARSAGIAVKLAGFHQRPDLPRMYAASDVFVFPTLGDPYGLVVDEAMAGGLPVISTTAAGEIRDRVLDGANGFLVPPNEPSALASAMRRLVVEPGLRVEMGARSMELISDHTPDSWAQAFEQAVGAILASRRVVG
jgi:glycosyltransferase involved in cell wall biosynthesis